MRPHTYTVGTFQGLAKSGWCVGLVFHVLVTRIVITIANLFPNWAVAFLVMVIQKGRWYSIPTIVRTISFVFSVGVTYSGCSVPSGKSLKKILSKLQNIHYVFDINFYIMEVNMIKPTKYSCICFSSWSCQTNIK